MYYMTDEIVDVQKANVQVYFKKLKNGISDLNGHIFARASHMGFLNDSSIIDYKLAFLDVITCMSNEYRSLVQAVYELDRSAFLVHDYSQQLAQMYTDTLCRSDYSEYYTEELDHALQTLRDELLNRMYDCQYIIDNTNFDDPSDTEEVIKIFDTLSYANEFATMFENVKKELMACGYKLEEDLTK